LYASKKPGSPLLAKNRVTMDLNLILFGLIETTNEFVDIYDVERGKKCTCICPSCRSPLIARHGDNNTWHFAHADKGVYDKMATNLRWGRLKIK
jgi:hypothetical protein